MKRSDKTRLGLRGMVAAAALCVAFAPLSAFAQPQALANSLGADAPLGGPGSLAGVWVKKEDPSGDTNFQGPDYLYGEEAVLTDENHKPIPIMPWAKAIVEKHLKDAAAGHPYASTQARCLPPGVPDMMFENGLMQFLETPRQITILRQEFTFFRIIHMDETKHPAPDDLDPTFLGHSIGHWEGDTLVIDTVGLNDETAVRFVIPHSDQLHIIERIRRTGRDAMEIRATIDDPKVFTAPWTEVTYMKRMPNKLTEYFCENNRNGTDKNGNETLIGPH